MAKTITMTLEEYNNDLAAARKEGEKTNKYSPVIELVKEITAWQAVPGGTDSILPAFSRRAFTVHNWSAQEIESKLRNLMHKIDGYS